MFTLNHTYMLKLGIGDPVKSLWFLLDIVAGLTWTQCQPCKSCYEQTIRFTTQEVSSLIKSYLAMMLLVSLHSIALKGTASMVSHMAMFLKPKKLTLWILPPCCRLVNPHQYLFKT